MGITMACGDPHGVWGLVVDWLLYLYVTFGNGFEECVSMCEPLDQSWKDEL